MNDEPEHEVKEPEAKPAPVNTEYDTPPKEFVPGTKVPEGKDPYEMTDAEYVQYCYENAMPFWAIKKSVLERYPPEITSLEPSTAEIGAESFQLKVNGQKFYEGSIIVFAGQDEPTDLNADRQLVTGINMGVWHGADVVPVQVRNGGRLSEPVDFTFTAGATTTAASHAPEEGDDEPVHKNKAKHKK